VKESERKWKKVKESERKWKKVDFPKFQIFRTPHFKQTSVSHLTERLLSFVSLNMGLVNFRCANHFISISLLNKKFKYLLWYLNCAVLIRRFIGEHLILTRYRIAFWNVTVVGLTIRLWVIQHRFSDIEI